MYACDTCVPKFRAKQTSCDKYGFKYQQKLLVAYFMIANKVSFCQTPNDKTGTE